MKFKIGDRVKYTSGMHGDRKRNPLWKGNYGKIIGTITSTGEYLEHRVEWDSGEWNGYNSSDLEHCDEYIVPEELFEI